jgi:hypothetical protein
MAHNLAPFCARLGLNPEPPHYQTVRRRCLGLPGRLTHSGRQRVLHLPAPWPWADAVSDCLRRLRAVELIT